MSDESAKSSSQPQGDHDDGETANRLACTDGNCLGVAQPDGHCSECGIFIGIPAQSDDEDERSPCPDGTCIGVIGPDGRCTECGELADDDGVDEEEDDDGYGDEDEDEDKDGDGGERVLCPDGACIGIIGPDGRCTECGRAADDEAS